MFRCITKLKSLVIDIDSFDNNEIEEWKIITDKYNCLFITCNEEKARIINKLYAEKKICKIEKFEKMFAPNEKIHGKVLSDLGVKTTEMIYVSKDLAFLSRAMGFLSGTVFIGSQMSYKEISQSPDLLCIDLNMLKSALDGGVRGFLGEEFIYPGEYKRGEVVPIELNMDDSTDVVKMRILGRYFGYVHYMNQLHPYSAAIFLNKKENGKVYGNFNNMFARLYISAIKKLQDRYNLNGVCAVPTRPGKINRFFEIIKHIENVCNLQDLSENMICLKDYPSQKGLAQNEREENVDGVFSYNGSLIGQSVVIIDDIVSTGATIKACARELKAKGAEQIFAVVLAVNQIRGNYWSSEEAYVSCPNCGEKMRLLVNSSSMEFFYLCSECNKTLDFYKGWERLYNHVNNEFEDVLILK